MFDLTNKKIFVTGHNGMVGSSVVRKLKKENLTILVEDRKKLDLSNQKNVYEWFNLNKPDVVILCAAKVGGILANNNFPADFIYQNIMIQSNLINASFLNNVKKLLFLGSSCIYPKFADQPIKEEYLMSGNLEPTNEFYAISKISGIKMCQAYRKQFNCDFISAMPTNLYGPNDNYDLNDSHVIPALIKKFWIAKKKNQPYVSIWGTGKPRREFLHVDDCADAILHLLKNYSEIQHINIGSGSDIEISDLAFLISDLIGFRGTLNFDKSKPDGTPQKLLDISKIKKLGWEPSIDLREGLSKTIIEFEKSLSRPLLKD